MKFQLATRTGLLIASVLLTCAGSTICGERDLDEGRLGAFVEDALNAYDAPGCAVGVVAGGQVILTQGYGLANVQSGRPVDGETQFQVQSVAKTFTASAVMQLKEQGLIGLHEPVSRYVPYFKLDDERFKAITVRMLLNHTSGIPTMYKAEFGWEHPELDEEALARYVVSLQHRNMEFDPGEKHAYSNNGYAILAALIENVSGLSFEEYMRLKVLLPAGMTRSSFSISEVDKKNFAAPHILGPDLSPAVCPFQPYNRWAASSGGLFSSAEDMTRWMLLSLDQGGAEGRLLNATNYGEMWSVSSDASDRMGLGWFIDSWRGRKLVSHPGGGLGYNAELCLLPEEGIGVVVLCNSRRGPTWEIVKAVVDLMDGREPGKVSPGFEMKVLDRIREGGIENGIQYYRQLRTEHDADDFSATELLVLGHRFLVSEHPDKEHLARRIFELAAEYYPDVAYVYDFLAEAYLKLALKNYRKAAALDPTIWGAAEKARAIEAELN